MWLCVVRQASIVSGMARQVWYFLFRCAGACCVTNRRVAVRQVSWGMLRYGKKRCGSAGMVGCVGSFYGQARRVLVRLVPVSWGRYGAVRCGKLR